MFEGVKEGRLGNRKRYETLWKYNVIWSNARQFRVMRR